MTIIEDFRLVSVSPHPQFFEPSPVDEPRVNFRVHDERQRCDLKTVPSGVTNSFDRLVSLSVEVKHLAGSKLLRHATVKRIVQ